MCAIGYSGTNCETDIDECATNPCLNGATCIDGINGFMCDCAVGYEGPTCAGNIDDCAYVTCLNGGTCVDGVNSHTCDCAAGYSGALCGTDDDECIGVTCHNGGTCVDGVNSYTCDCAAGYIDTHCETDEDDCVGETCNNGGTCVDEVAGFHCDCVAGYADTYCDVDVDDCVGACLNSGVCTDLVNDYSCACASGWEGKDCGTDTDECSPDPCNNGACTTPSHNDYNCACEAGWKGKDCDTDVDECSEPSAIVCGGLSTCTNGAAKFTCTCAAGWQKSQADDVVCTDIDECSEGYTANSCQNGATCTNQLDAYSCTCVNGFSGTNCDECAAGKGFVAAYGGGQGTCSDCTFADRAWNNEVTHNAPCATQQCADGYGVTSDSATWVATGHNCEECGAGYESGPGSGVCGDVDECQAGTVLGVTRAAVVCGGSSTCQNEVGTDEYICNCAPGWVGGGADDVCTECPKGTKEVSGVCVQCPKGTYGDAMGATACTDCDAGKYNDQVGSINDDACTDCPDRTFNPSPQGTDASDCQACAHCKETDEDQTNCNTDRDVDCEYTAFSAWGVCDETCHEGQAHRSRSITVDHCNGGDACPHLNQKKPCVDQLCDCAKVMCKWEAHTCTNFQLTADFGTTSSLFYRSNVNSLGAVTGGVPSYDDPAGDSTGSYAYTGYTDNADNYVAPGIDHMGLGDYEGTKTSDDSHAETAACDDTSVRVYHHDQERAGEGHHCKYAVGGECKCRCHSMFTEANGYNPKSGIDENGASYSGSKFDYNVPIVQDNVDGTPY
jgi:Notch-like protein